MAPLPSLREILPPFSTAGASIECPGCGGPLEVTAARCPDCDVAVIVECRDCGAAPATQTKHCQYCGGTEYEVFGLE